MLFILNRYKFFILSTFLLCFLGWAFKNTLPISIYPMISKPAVRVTIHIVDDPYTFFLKWGEKIERAMGDVDGVDFVEATYEPEKIRLFAHFDWGSNPQEAKQKIATAISFFQAQQPKYLPAIKVDFYDPASENYVAITSEQYDAVELSRMLESELLPVLQGIKGIADAWISKKTKRKIRIELHPFKLIRYGVTTGEIVKQLSDREYDINLGKINTISDGKIGIYLDSSINNLDKIKALTISSRQGMALSLADIADVKIVHEDSGRFFQYDENNVVAVAAWAEPNSNIYRVSTAFIDEVSKYTADKGQLLILNTPKRFIESSVLNIITALLLGMLIASLVVLVVYKRLADIVLICMTIPITLLVSLLVMAMAGIGLNLFSLGAMAIASGMVIDGAVLVIDELRKSATATAVKGKISLSMANILPSLFTANLTSLIVFIPLAFTLPLISSLLKDTVFVIAIMLTVSLFVNAVFLPCVYLLLKRKSEQNNDPRRHNGVFVWLCQRLLHSNMGIRLIIVLAILVFSVVNTVHYGSFIKREVIAQPRASIIDINVPFAADGWSDEQKVTVVAGVRAIVKREFSDKIDYIYTDFRASNAYISLHLHSYKDFAAVYNNIGPVLAKTGIDGIGFEPWITSALNINKSSDLRVVFTSHDDEENRLLINEMKQWLADNSAVVRHTTFPKNRKIDSYAVNLSSHLIEKAFSDANWGGEEKSLLEFLRFGVEPKDLFTVKLDGEYAPLQLSIKRDFNIADSIKEIPIGINDSNIFIQDLVNFVPEKRWREYYSRNAKLNFAVEVWFAHEKNNHDKRLFVAKLKQHLQDKLDMERVALMVEDTSIETTRSLESLFIALSLSVALVFLAVLLQFSSLWQTFIVLMAIPTAISGAISSLLIFDSTISLNSMLGILILIGLSINNSIILVDSFNKQMMANDTSVGNALVNIVMMRLKPIIVTNLTTVFCMLPLAIGFGAEQDILKPLGISVVGGLLISTVMTIVIVPLILSMTTRQPIK